MTERWSANPSCSNISSDFINKSVEIKSLGSGTFGRVALYDTPLGQGVIKETKVEDKSLGYPSDFLTEVDMLFKLRPIKSVVSIKGVCFDNDKRKGYILLEPLDCNLSQWYTKTPFKERISQLLNIITMIGGTIGIMHHLSLVHNDLKPNNILVKEEDDGLIFKLADFGTSAYIIDPNVHYCGIEQYKPPKISDIYHSEFWAFMVSLVEVIIGKKLVNIKKEDKCTLFYNSYLTPSISGMRPKFELPRYLKSVLTTKEYKMIPSKFWIFIDNLINGQDTNITNSLYKIGINLNTNLINEVSKCISRAVPIQPRFNLIEKEFKEKFTNVQLSSRYFDRFSRLYNKFLSLISEKQHLSSIDLRYYAEVAFVIVARSKAIKFDYFEEQEQFLLFERAFLNLIQYQTVIC